MKDIMEIMFDKLEENNDYPPVMDTVFNYFDIDQLVGWFVDGYYGCDKDSLLMDLGEDYGKEILNYYDLHC